MSAVSSSFSSFCLLFFSSTQEVEINEKYLEGLTEGNINGLPNIVHCSTSVG